MTDHQVITPLPGVFYRAPSPGEPPFAEVGDAVTADQTIGLVEIMKQFTPILAEVDGTITAFDVENEAMLNPGDVVATIEVSG